MNSLKAIQDAWKGILWVDDSQVVELHAYRGDDKERPGVVVTAVALEDVKALSSVQP